MSNKGTLLDLKKFRFGRRSQYEISENKSYNIKLLSHIPGINETFTLPYNRNMEVGSRRMTNIGDQPLYQSHSGVNIGHSPISLNRNYIIQRKLPLSNLPDFLTKHPSYNNISVNKRDGPILKKSNIKILEDNINKQQVFTFAWEAFPSYTPHQIYTALDYFDWNLDFAVHRLEAGTLNFDSAQLDPSLPLKKMSEEELRSFLEESEDEFMEDDDSQERFARSDFDPEEYNFIMDHPPALVAPVTPSNPSTALPSSANPSAYQYGGHPGYAAYPQQQTGGAGPIYPVPNRRSMTDYFLDTFNTNARKVARIGSGLGGGALQNRRPGTVPEQTGFGIPDRGQGGVAGIGPGTSAVSDEAMDEDGPGLEISLEPSAYGNVAGRRPGQTLYQGVPARGPGLTPGAGPRPNSRTLTERDGILEFFNASTREELLSLKHCSVKKAEVIMQQRPFVSWDELNAKFERFKFLSVDLIQAAKKMLYLRKQIVKLLQHCEQLSNELQGAVEKLAQGTMIVQPSQAITSSGHVLKPYQVAGMNWLNLLYKMGMNGILADEMGLGKTVQLLAFLQHILETGVKGPFLIIVPASTLDNWASEISIWCPDARFTTYYGSQSERKDQRNQLMEEQGIDTWDIILTTYSMVSSTTDDKNFFKRISFTYIVFDEAHMLKNMASVRYKYLLKIKARFRVLLTGTPIQNNLLELMSLLQFVLPNLFEDRTEELKSLFSAYDSGPGVGLIADADGEDNAADSEDVGADEIGASASSNEGDASVKQPSRPRGSSRSRSDFERARVAQAKHVVRPFVLRRLKSQVLDQLPPKRQEITLCEMGPDQAALYSTILEDYKAQVAASAEVSGNKDGGPHRENALPPMNVMMKLRKVANHPLMMRSLYTEDLLRQMSAAMINEPTHKHAVPDLIFEDMKVLNDFELYKLTKAFPSIASFKLSPHVIKDSAKFRYLDSLLPQILENNEKALVFSQFTQMLDILQEYLTLANMAYMRIDGTTPVPDRLTLIKKFTSDPDCHIFLLSTKAGGLGINLTCANRVVIHDIDINPYNDKQAEDRCHRVGQEKTVMVNRLITKGTVEEIILRYNQEKLKLEKSMTGANKSITSPGMVFAGGEDVFANEYDNDVDGTKSRDTTEENNEEIANLLKIALG